jgi:hypothetical protein
MAVDVTLNKYYQLRNRDIFVSVAIGEGQFGTSDVILDGKRIVRVSGPIGKLLIGPGGDLAGKTLTVRTVVNDVSTLTNRMSVTYRLDGGKSRAEFTSRSQVTVPGDLLVFEANFSLE